MSAVELVLLVGFLVLLVLLALATAANQELAEENRRLRASIHPATRKASR